MEIRNKGSSQEVLLKYCGITRTQDVLHALRLGVDYLGFNFWNGSKRAIKASEARQIWLKALDTQQKQGGVHPNPPATKTIGILVNPSRSEVEETLQSFPELNGLQFHGHETIEFVASMTSLLKSRMPAVTLWKAVPISLSLALDHTQAAAELVDLLTPWRGQVELLLLDAAPQSYSNGEGPSWGGLGLSFDWYLLKDPRVGQVLSSMPWGLAGGIKGSNLGQAIALKPNLIDICSGIEKSPGIKDPVKLDLLWSQTHPHQKLPS